MMMHRFIQCKFREHLNSIEAKEVASGALSSSASSSSTAAAGKIPRAYRQEWKLSMVASPRAPHVTLCVSMLKDTEGLRHACEDFVNEVEETTSMMPGKANVGLLEQCKHHFGGKYLNLKESEPPGDLFASLVQHLQRRKRSSKKGPTTKEAADVSAPCTMPNSFSFSSSSSSTSTSSMDEAEHPDPRGGSALGWDRESPAAAQPTWTAPVQLREDLVTQAHRALPLPLRRRR